MHKRMVKVGECGDNDIYIYSPTLFNLYYPDKNKDGYPSFKFSFLHKLRMALKLFGGGYKIIYFMKGEKVVSYLIYCQRPVIKGMKKGDIFTIYIHTFPEFRKQGLASKMINYMLNESGLKYESAYKTIANTNIASTKTAEKAGYKALCYCEKNKLLGKYYKREDGNWQIFVKEKA